jgi:hypothetical protein
MEEANWIGYIFVVTAFYNTLLTEKKLREDEEEEVAATGWP